MTHSRTCPECGDTKPLRTGFYRWKDKRYGKWRWSKRCRECTRQRARARYFAIMADPYTAELERARKRTQADRKGPANAARCKRYRERLRTQRPEEYQRQLEDARIRTRLWQERKGHPLTPTRHWVGKGRYVFLDADPIRVIAAGVHPEDKTLARTIYRVFHESNRVELSVVDAITLAAGLLPQDVYPELAA